MTTPDHKLQASLLLARALPGDRLQLADATLLAALDGTRPLTPNERRALQASPLTLRRFRQLALARRAAPQAANDPAWAGSAGMLRAAASGGLLDSLVTDDGYWTLHFVPQTAPATPAADWQLILALAPEAPFAARLLREQPMLRVVDGGGAILLQGRLDADGECERAWAFGLAPMAHFQLYGGAFTVEPVPR